MLQVFEKSTSNFSKKDCFNQKISNYKVVWDCPEMLNLKFHQFLKGEFDARGQYSHARLFFQKAYFFPAAIIVRE